MTERLGEYVYYYVVTGAATCQVFFLLASEGATCQVVINQGVNHVTSLDQEHNIQMPSSVPSQHTNALDQVAILVLVAFG